MLDPCWSRGRCSAEFGLQELVHVYSPPVTIAFETNESGSSGRGIPLTTLGGIRDKLAPRER